MADQVLFVHGQFGERSSVRKHEDRIEAKTLVSPSLETNVAIQPAIKDARPAPRECVVYKVCFEGGLSFLRRYSLQFEEQLIDLLVVVGRVSGRVEAGSSSEGFHFQAGIVGERVESEPVGDLACLFRGIAEIGRSVFYDINQLVKICQRKEPVEAAIQKFLDLAEFALVCRCYYDALHCSDLPTVEIDYSLEREKRSQSRLLNTGDLCYSSV